MFLWQCTFLIKGCFCSCSLGLKASAARVICYEIRLLNMVTIISMKPFQNKLSVQLKLCKYIFYKGYKASKLYF